MTRMYIAFAINKHELFIDPKINRKKFSCLRISMDRIIIVKAGYLYSLKKQNNWKVSNEFSYLPMQYFIINSFPSTFISGLYDSHLKIILQLARKRKIITECSALC